MKKNPFGSGNPYFPSGKAGHLVAGAKIDGDVASDPAAFPMFKGSSPLTAAGKAAPAKWNPRNNVLPKCGTKGTPLIMISPLPMEFSRQSDKIIMWLDSVSDSSGLDYILTTIDPVNFTRSFDLKRYFVWKPENTVHPYECLDRFVPGK